MNRIIPNANIMILLRTISFTFIVFLVTSCRSPRSDTGGELGRLIQEVAPPARYVSHRPTFRVIPTTVTFQGPKGPYQETFDVVWDGDRAIALRSQGMNLDLFTYDPAAGFTTIPWPARYHNSTVFGTRLTTIPWIGAWEPTGSDHDQTWQVSDDRRSITLHEWQVWDGSKGKMKTPGRVDYRFTIHLDPVLGYIVDLVAELRFVVQPHESRGLPQGFEYTNFLEGRMADVWPHRQRYDYTVYTPGSGDIFAGHRFAGWANHTVAGDLSDYGKRKRRVRGDGFIAFMDRGGNNPFLATSLPFPLRLATCNVWQDQHNLIDMPKPDADGVVTLTWTARHGYLPPEITTAVMGQLKVDDFDGQQGTVVRFGIDENFDDQPIPLTKPIRGATNLSLHLDGTHARSGTKSLMVQGVIDNDDFRGGFLHTPQIRLEPNRRHLIEAWVWLENDGMRASITADTYEWTPHNKERLERIETNVVTVPGQWQHLKVEVNNGPIDVFTDLRFRVTGKGRAWFDDFHMVVLPEGGRPAGDK